MSNYTTNPTISVCVGNYGYYAEGELRDQWLHLPMPTDKLAKWPKENGLYDAMHEEIYISDFNCEHFDLYKMFGMNIRLDDLNRLAYAMSIEPDGIETVERYLDLADKPETIGELIELVLNWRDISYSDFPVDHWGDPSLELFGIELADDYGLLKALEDNGAGSCFDFKQFAEDNLMDYLYDEKGWLLESFSYQDYSRAELDELLIESASEKLAHDVARAA